MPYVSCCFLLSFQKNEQNCLHNLGFECCFHLKWEKVMFTFLEWWLWWEKIKKCLQILWDSLGIALVDLCPTSYVSWLKRKRQIRSSINTGYSGFSFFFFFFIFINIPYWLNAWSFLLLWHKLILARANWMDRNKKCRSVYILLVWLSYAGRPAAGRVWGQPQYAQT